MFKYQLLIVFCLAMTQTHGQYIPKFDIQGHRGARGLRPENTIPAFIAALEYGVTTVELDLAVTLDSQLVVSHEPYMNGDICLLPDGAEISEKEEKRYNIYQMTYEQVRKFDCGSSGNPKFPEQQKMAAAKPLLRDVIVAIEDNIKNFSRYEVDYNIEIKSSPEGDSIFHPGVPKFCDMVYSLLDEYLPLDRVVIQSFDFRVLQYMHAQYPTVRLAALVENAKSIESNLKDLGFNPSIYSPYYKLISKQKIDYLHKNKIRIIPWTVNEIADMKKMKAWGTDGFITDYPNRANALGFTLRK